MKNRNGEISNGYWGSPDHKEDLEIAGFSRGILRDLSWDIGVWCWVLNFITYETKILYLRCRRWVYYRILGL